MSVSSLLIFPKQILVVDGEDEAIVNKTLKLCYREKIKDPVGRSISNEGGWQSEGFVSGCEMYEHLNELLAPIIERGFQGEVVDQNWNPKISNVWINISPPGAMNISHFHPMSIFSGVFYLQTPEGCGNIVFEEDGHRSAEISLRTERNKQQTAQYQTYWIPAIKGRMILFPSTLRHHVERNRSEDDRVSISFNIGFW